MAEQDGILPDGVTYSMHHKSMNVIDWLLDSDYPMLTRPGDDITWGELHVGTSSMFAAAGFEEVSRPSHRRVVMRIDF